MRKGIEYSFNQYPTESLMMVTTHSSSQNCTQSTARATVVTSTAKPQVASTHAFPVKPTQLQDTSQILIPTSTLLYKLSNKYLQTIENQHIIRNE